MTRLTTGLKTGLRARLWSLCALVLLGTTAAVLWLCCWQLRTTLEAELSTRGALLASGADEVQGPDLRARLEDLARHPDVLYAAVEDAQGNAVAQSAKAPAAEVLALQNPRTGLAADKRTVRAPPLLGSEGAEVLDVAVWNPVTAHDLHVGLSLARVGDEWRATTLRVVSIGLALTGGALVLAFLLITAALGPLHKLTNTAIAFRAGGVPNFEPLILLSQGAGEPAELARTFQALVQRQQETPAELRIVSNRLSESVQRILGAAAKHGDLLDRQSAALQEAQVTAQQIRQVSLAAATSVSGVIEAAEQAEDLGNAGELALEGSVDALTAIRTQVEAISRQIGALAERTTQIGAVTATVKELADQSSILALNAAIEAVRSGQHGQGFSTVAHEIRSLADQSIEATQRVRELLEDIDRATREAVRFTEQGAQRIDKGLLEVRATGDALRQLSTLVRQNATAVRQIATSVGQQNAGIAQLFDAINDLGKMVEAGTSDLSATEEATVEIESLAIEVAQTLERLRGE